MSSPDEASKNVEQRNLSRMVFGCLLILIVTPLSCMGWIAWELGLLTPHPTDEQIIALVRDRDVTFDQILSMFDEDARLETVGFVFIRPEIAISESRWVKYKELLESVGAMSATRRDDGGITFVLERKGSALGGSVKGLVYQPSDPNPLYENLNERPADLSTEDQAYRRIDDDWYITYWYH